MQPYDCPDSKLGFDCPKTPNLSDDQIEEIAERAAERAVKKLTDEAYKAVGKSVLDKLFYIVGVLAAAAFFWATSKGWIKP